MNELLRSVPWLSVSDCSCRDSKPLKDKNVLEMVLVFAVSPLWAIETSIMARKSSGKHNLPQSGLVLCI